MAAPTFVPCVDGSELARAFFTCPLFGRYGVESGHHRLVVSISAFDPWLTSGIPGAILARIEHANMAYGHG
jgi:hypothetical protein